MKDRILKILKKAGYKDYADVWGKGRTYTADLTIDGFCHECVYLKWAGMEAHLNVLTDKLCLFFDEKKVVEE